MPSQFAVRAESLKPMVMRENGTPQRSHLPLFPHLVCFILGVGCFVVFLLKLEVIRVAI